MILYLLVTSFRIIVTLATIFFITPQISLAGYNYVLEKLYSFNIFLDYPAAQKFLVRFTWFCIIFYIFLNIFTSLFLYTV